MYQWDKLMTDKQKEIADMMLKDILFFSKKIDMYHNLADVKARCLLVKSYKTYMKECRKQNKDD